MIEPKLYTTQADIISNAYRRKQFPSVLLTEEPLYTGRFFITFDEKGDTNNYINFFENSAGLTVATTSDFNSVESRTKNNLDADVLLYENFGVALVGTTEEQVTELASVATERMIIEPELIVSVPDDVQVGLSNGTTWGLQAIQLTQNNLTGRNVKVAILDTGFDLNHPDFAGREIKSASFIPGESVQDQHGHGTHCTGVACGYEDNRGNRYGIAYQSEIHIAKVLNNNGKGPQQAVLDGIDWALERQCKIISMSLSSRIYAGQGANAAYEKASQFALSRGSLLIAAAGNDSVRSQNYFVPVSSPANCPSVLGIGAIDSKLNVADFSNRAINAGIPGGTVDIVAPGVDIYSSWPMGIRYKSISGTSMATPHVSGIAALIWETSPGASPLQIAHRLMATAQRLTHPAIDVGAGMVIAP